MIPKSLISLMTVIVTVMSIACGEAHDHGVTHVKVSALFTPVSEVTVFDEGGGFVTKAAGQEGVTLLDLPPGSYFIEVRDDYGNSPVDNSGRLLFVVRAEGAEIVMDLAPVPGREISLLPMYVGEGHTHDQNGYSAHGLHTFTPGDTPSMRSRLVWEAAKALVGPSLATGYVFPLSETLGTFNYAGDDPGAWSALRTSYTAYNVSCRHDNDASNQYGPCAITYGSDNASQYGYQGGAYRGGQCKPFTALVAYRSGVYHGPNWAFVSLPSDGNTTVPTHPKATISTITTGDVLRNPTSGQIHSVIVVRITGNANNDVVVVDSNWVNGGDGRETIGAHVLNFSGSGRSNLGTYNRYNCIYTASTADGC